MNRSLGFLPFLMFVTVVGCQRGDKPQYANVKGKVTFNGNPLEKGEISFTKAGQPPSTMKIVDGAFNGQAMIGENRVSVSAWKHSATPPKLPKEAQIQQKGYIEKFKRSPK